MNERHDRPSADLTAASVGKRKRTKKTPLWSRIIFDERMVAVVRLLGHEGMLRSDAPHKFQPLIEKFGRERLTEVTDEIVEIIGDGDAAVARLTEQARKLAIQLIGRPRPESSAATADRIAAHSQSSARNEPEAVPPTPETNSATPCEPNRSPSLATSPATQTTSEAEPLESSTSLDGHKLEHCSQDWANYETSCVAAFLNGDRQFTDECFHLAKLCCERAAHCESVTSGAQTESQAKTLLLADHLQRFVCEYNPLVEDMSLFTDLLDAALNNVDWHDLADSFLKRAAEERGES